MRVFNNFSVGLKLLVVIAAALVGIVVMWGVGSQSLNAAHARIDKITSGWYSLTVIDNVCAAVLSIAAVYFAGRLCENTGSMPR